MLVRVVRAISGSLLLLAGIPLLLAGGGLWFAAQHQDPTGGYAAKLSTVTSDGYAVVSSDLDGLLRREVPFARSGRTTLELTAETPDGPAFLGLAPAEAVATYLAGVPYSQVDEVRLARGPLPVVTTEVAGENELGQPPQQQRFWLASSDSGVLSWSAEDLRGEQVALVVMSPDVESPLTVDLRARVHPHWLGSTTVGLLLLGTVLTLVAVALLVWPHRSRQVVYVVPPAEVPQVAARLGVAVPGAESESASARSTGLSLAPGLYGAPTGQEALTEVRANGVDSRLGGASVGNTGLQLRAVIARIPYARVEGHPGGSGGDAGQPTPVNPEEEGAGESDDYQLDTVPMTDRARGEGEAEPVAQAAAVDAVDPESGSGAGPDAASDDVEDLPEGGSESSEDAAAADGEADSEGAGSAEGDAVSSEEVVPELAQWEWPPIVQQSTAAPDPVPVRS